MAVTEPTIQMEPQCSQLPFPPLGSLTQQTSTAKPAPDSACIQARCWSLSLSFWLFTSTSLASPTTLRWLSISARACALRPPPLLRDTPLALAPPVLLSALLLCRTPLPLDAACWFAAGPAASVAAALAGELTSLAGEPAAPEAPLASLDRFAGEFCRGAPLCRAAAAGRVRQSSRSAVRGKAVERFGRLNG